MKKERLVESVKKKNGGQLPDERQQQANSTVVACALVFGAAFDFIMMIYYFVTKNAEGAYPYVAQLVIMSIGCLIASLGTKEAQPPTILFSRRSVNTDKTTRAFFSRIGWCMLDSLVLAGVITLFDIYTDGKVTGSLISDGIILFCVITIMESIFCEIKVQRYRKYMAILDAEENDLED